MFTFFLSWMILSNICHLILYMKKGDISFKDSLIAWNTMTIVFLLWLILWKPTNETMDWLAKFIR
jgi:hypothetical protein